MPNLVSQVTLLHQDLVIDRLIMDNNSITGGSLDIDDVE